MLSRDGYIGSCKPRSTGLELCFYEAQRKVMESLVNLCCCDSDNAKALLISVRFHTRSLIHWDKTQSDEIYQISRANNLSRFPAPRFLVDSISFFKIITLCCLASRRSPPCPSSCLRRSVLCRAESPRRFILAPRTRWKQ